MKKDHLKLGESGEETACLYLAKKGYRVISRNYRAPYGEIDVVVKASDKTLVFVEVKTLIKNTSDTGLLPEDNLTLAKREKLFRVCQQFANANRALIDERRGWRIDLVAIEVPGDWEKMGVNDLRKASVIRHYENI
jgi:putative endonuclease